MKSDRKNRQRDDRTAIDSASAATNNEGAGSFTFACPNCGQHLTAEQEHIGMSLECPACNGQLVVPVQKIQNLHQLKNSHKKKIGLMIGSAVASIIVVAIVVSTLRKTPASGRASSHSNGDRSTASLQENATSIENVLSNYLSSPTAEDRSRFVANRDHVLPIMKDHYKGKTKLSRLKKINNEELKGTLGETKIFSAEADYESQDALGNSVTGKFKYYFLQEGNRLSIDWLASQGFNAVSMRDLKDLSKSHLGPVRMRLNANLDDYYNYEYKSLEEFTLSVSLVETMSAARVHAYVKRDSELGNKLRNLLNYESVKELTFLIRDNRASADKSFVIIDDLVREDWAPEFADELNKRETLIEKRTQFEQFVKEQSTIDDILKEGKRMPTLLPLRKIYRDYAGNLEGVDFSGRRIKLVSSEKVTKELDAHLKGSGFQDELSLFVVKSDSDREKSLTILELMYTGPHIETDIERSSRESRQLEIARSLDAIFGDERDKLIQTYASQHVRDQLRRVKRGEKPEYDSTIDLLSSLLVCIKDKRYPQTEAEQKAWLKNALGTPDSSDMDSFNQGNYLSWAYWNVLKNQDTEKYSENVKLAFVGNKIMIFISGPSGQGSVGGGIRHPAGIETRTYVDLAEVLKTNINILMNK